MQVSFTDNEGNVESLTGDATSAVEAKPAVAVVGFSVSDARVSESSSPDGQHLVFIVTLDKPSDRSSMVSFRTRDGTARYGDHDYYAASGTLFFFPGEQEKVVRVYVPPSDGETEGEETMELVLYQSRGAPIADGVGVGTITD